MTGNGVHFCYLHGGNHIQAEIQIQEKFTFRSNMVPFSYFLGTGYPKIYHLSKLQAERMILN